MATKQAEFVVCWKQGEVTCMAIAVMETEGEGQVRVEYNGYVQNEEYDVLPNVAAKKAALTAACEVVRNAQQGANDTLAVTGIVLP